MYIRKERNIAKKYHIAEVLWVSVRHSIAKTPNLWGSFWIDEFEFIAFIFMAINLIQCTNIQQAFFLV